MAEQLCGITLDEQNNNRRDAFSSLQGGNIILYGAGGIGYVTSCILKERACNVCCFADDNTAKQGTYVNGIRVSAINDISCNSDVIILICLPNPMEVYNRLVSMGYSDVRYYPVMMSERNFYNIELLKESREKIDTVYSLLADEFSRTVFCNILKHRITMDFSYFNNIISEKQYFPSDIFNLGYGECFVDGGVYNGETIADFLSATNNNFDYIYGFEPDRKNYERLAKEMMYKDGERLKLFNSGLYSINGRAGFNGQGNSSSCICGSGEDTVSLVRLDDIIGEHKPTYIKLDIEGAEEEALYGMRDTILKYHPRLAISVYHKASDLWELPLLIHSISASYRLYLRHYSNGLFETVCYAI